MSDPVRRHRFPLRAVRAGRLRALAGLVLALAVAAGPAAGQGDVLVIVNEANPVSTLREDEVSQLFLKRVDTFSDGTRAAPVDLTEGAAARASFSRWIHHKTTASIKALWQTMIFSGRSVPPPEKTSPESVVAFVRAQRGGIGYVPQGTALGTGVKVLTVVAR